MQKSQNAQKTPAPGHGTVSAVIISLAASASTAVRLGSSAATFTGVALKHSFFLRRKSDRSEFFAINVISIAMLHKHINIRIAPRCCEYSTQV